MPDDALSSIAYYSRQLMETASIRDFLRLRGRLRLVNRHMAHSIGLQSRFWTRFILAPHSSLDPLPTFLSASEGELLHVLFCATSSFADAESANRYEAEVAEFIRVAFTYFDKNFGRCRSIRLQASSERLADLMLRNIRIIDTLSLRILETELPVDSYGQLTPHCLSTFQFPMSTTHAAYPSSWTHFRRNLRAPAHKLPTSNQHSVASPGTSLMVEVRVYIHRYPRPQPFDPRLYQSCGCSVRGPVVCPIPFSYHTGPSFFWHDVNGNGREPPESPWFEGTYIQMRRLVAGTKSFLIRNVNGLYCCPDLQHLLLRDVGLGSLQHLLVARRSAGYRELATLKVNNSADRMKTEAHMAQWFDVQPFEFSIFAIRLNGSFAITPITMNGSFPL
ncbi:hypothetical protein C8F04DRAFT_1300324 [Mycena alexandri]|uniref:Uncharacterized protein n=1 Tax=Mycena alexandri TaxID=1745969 RepID=A0AAD6SCR6_9AGAR|nr:hypothetical protein C8F04DRAFT_1300324 [Mycena alexandri]